MVTWNNLDTIDSYQELLNTERVNLAEVMTGEIQPFSQLAR